MDQLRPMPKVTAGAIAIFAILILVYVASIDIRATRGASITGDEPFYLITTQSLIEDRNLDLRRQYELHSYESFFDHRDGLWTQSSARDNGKLLSPHNPGLSIFIIPGFKFGGLIGVQIQMMIMAALTFSLSYILLVKIIGRFWISWFTTIGVAITATAIIYSTEIYPEFPAALSLIIALLIIQKTNQTTIWQATGLLLCLTAMVWFGVKYAPLAGLVAVWGFWRMDSPVRAVFLVFTILTASLYCWFHLETFGGLTPYSVNLVYSGDGTISILGSHLDFTQRLYRPLGLFLDERFGIARWAPILLFVLPAVPLLWKINGLPRLVLALIVVQIFIATFVVITMMGWWFPGRTLVTVLPLMGLPLAILLMQSPIWVRFFLGLFGAYSLVITAFLAVSGHTREIVIAVDPFDMSSPIFRSISPIVPDYRIWDVHTWTLTLIWVAVIGLLTFSFYFAEIFNQSNQPAEIAEN